MGFGMESSIQRTIADDDTALVSVRGEIDFANCDELAAAVRDAVTEWSPRVVHVDLQGATFVDSTGLGALIEGYQATTEAGARFSVINPSFAFHRVLEVTGLSDFFGLTPSSIPDTAETQATGS
jgi:anti-sigma B factor antagonist